MTRSQRRKLAITTFFLFAACAGQMLAGAATNLKGAGATFPAPIYARWFASYRERNPQVEITYDAVGSEAGVQKLLAGGVEIGASDNPEILRELAPNDQAKYLFFPSVVGAVVPIVNLPGIPGDLSFTPETLAGIYLGKITKWNDPLLRKANPRLRLPNVDIAVVHRADGSGTSYAWSDYLSETNPEWKARVGTGMAPKWPVGRAASGNDGVARAVKEFGGSIGYVEFIYALQNYLSYGKILNQKGEFIAADLESISAAVTHSVTLNSDFKGSIVDAPGARAYPIASFTWFVVPAHIADEAKRNAVAEFLTWMPGEGQRQAAAVKYVALPREIVSSEKAAVTLIQPGIH
jgi:phosphate transport system substrate-binding protein